jgi:hypothetical protein
LRVNYKDLLVVFCFIIFVLSLLVLANSSETPIDIKILSIENLNGNLVINTSFNYAGNNTPYVGSIAIRGLDTSNNPSTQSWGYTSDGLNTFTILNRQIQDFSELTVFAEPLEDNNLTYFSNTTFVSPLNNTTVSQNITENGDNTTVNVNVSNVTENSSIPVIIISNDTNSTVIISTDGNGSGLGSITINNTDNIQTVVPGKITGGDPKNPSSYTGFKTMKSSVYHNKAVNNGSNDGVGMRECGTPIDDFLLLIGIVIVLIIFGGRQDGG